VSGPAAGLTITLIAIQKNLGSFDGLLVAGILAGVMQIAFGLLRAGLLATFFPSSVIKGMLAGIGILIALKQLPHAVGWQGDFYNPEEGLICVLSPFCLHDVVKDLTYPHSPISLGAILISAIGVGLLMFWDSAMNKLPQLLRRVPGPLVVVIIGVILNALFHSVAPLLAATAEKGQLVSIPKLEGLSDLFIHGPHGVSNLLFSAPVWWSALTIALIASIETLLCIEATDKLDPLRRVSRPNRELIAQGIGNMLACFFGGIPMTSVIVRSSANVYAGARTRLACAFHGLFLLLSVVAIPTLLSLIPLSALAAILIMVGYKLANVKLFKSIWRSGTDQFLPFIITVAGVVLIDLLSGVLIGTVVGLVVVLIMNHHAAFTLVKDGPNHYLRFAKDATFLQKIALKRCLAQLPNHSHIVIDGGHAMFIDHDILELIEEFKDSAVDRHIVIQLRNMPAMKLNLLSIITQPRSN
jgi:MFS superfamily sulfate permease-like transporter